MMEIFLNKMADFIRGKFGYLDFELIWTNASIDYNQTATIIPL